jgi:integrase
MGSIAPYKGKHRAHICINGKRKSKVFASKREAEQWIRITEHAIVTTPDNQHTLRELLELYRDTVTPKKRGKRWEFIRINAYLNSSLPVDKDLSQCTSEVLGQWRDKRQSVDGVGAGTIIRDFGLLSAIFEHARRELKWIDANPVKDVRKPASPRHREVVINWRQVKLIVKDLGYSPTKEVRTLSQSVGLCFLLALRTGMRAGELCNLTWDQVHDGYCVLTITKTIPRQVPLSSKALRLLAKAKNIDHKSVFSLTSQTLDSLFRKSKMRCGISGLTFHDSRHTAATMMARNRNIDVLTLCKIFGWSNTSQALTYYNPKAKDIAKLL